MVTYNVKEVNETNGIQTVIATIAGQDYKLTYEASTDSWVAQISAPAVTSWHEEEHKYGITITAQNDAGSELVVGKEDETWGERLKLRVRETDKPVISECTITDGSYITTLNPIVKFKVTDQTRGSGINTDSISLTLGGKSYTTENGLMLKAIENGYEVSFLVESALTEGSNSLMINVTDNDDNAAETYVANFIADATAPQLVITNPTESYTKINTNRFRLEGTVQESTGGSVTLEIKVNGKVVSNGDVTNGAFQHDLVFTELVNNIEIKATNRAGLSTQVITRTIEVDDRIPKIDNVEIIPGYDVNTGTSYTIRVKVSQGRLGL